MKQQRQIKKFIPSLTFTLRVARHPLHRFLPQSPSSSTPFADKENQQESPIVHTVAPRSSAGKLTTNTIASSSCSLKKRPSSTPSALTSLLGESPALGKSVASLDEDRALTPSDLAVCRAAGALVEPKGPNLGSKLRASESDEVLLRCPCSAQSSPSGPPLRRTARPSPPRSVNPVARTLWNGGREDVPGAAARAMAPDARGATADVDEPRPPLLRTESTPSRVDIATAGSTPSPATSGRRRQRSELIGLAATPPRIDGSRVFRPQPKRLRIFTY